MLHRYKTAIGDWSKDGHNEFDTVIFDSNLDKGELQNLYNQMCETFGHDYCEVVAKDYQDNSVPDSLVAKMKELGHYNDEWFSCTYTKEELEKEKQRRKAYSWYSASDIEEMTTNSVCSDTYLDLMFKLMQYCNKEFKYKFVGDESIPGCHFGGWGGSGGYGLFSS